MLVSVIRSSYWLPWRGLPSYLVMSWLHLPPVSSLWKVKNSVLVCSSCHIKILQTGWPKLQKFISHTSRSWEAQDQGAIPLSSWWGFSGLQLDHLLATTSREISSVRVGGGGDGRGATGNKMVLCRIIVYGHWFCRIKAPLFWLHLTLITTVWASFPNTTTLGLGLQDMNLGGKGVDTNFQSIKNIYSRDSLLSALKR